LQGQRRYGGRMPNVLAKNGLRQARRPPRT